MSCGRLAPPYERRESASRGGSIDCYLPSGHESRWHRTTCGIEWQEGSTRKTLEDVRAIVGRVSFMDRELRVDVMGDGFFVQVRYYEECINTGRRELQSARKWYVSPHSTETEIVETCFAACERSMMHVTKEHFTYRNRRVYSPHFDVEARLKVCDEGRFDERPPPPSSEETSQ